MRLSRILIGSVAGLVVISSSAWASGISFGENGVRALSMGGAFVGQADDPSAIQHNPAGLARLTGFRFLVDAQLASNSVEFQRTDAAGNTGVADPVSNLAGPFLAPMVAVTYGFESLPLTLALGAYGPPAVGRSAYPEPNYAKNAAGTNYQESPQRTSPQRFALLSSNTLVVYPTLSAAYAFHPRFSAGISVQYIYSKLDFSQVISAAPSATLEQQGNPFFDNTVNLAVQGLPMITGVAGLWFSPLDRLSFGASIRPPIRLRARGTLDVQFGEGASAVQAGVTGNATELRLALPLELKIGTHVQVLPALGLNLDLVYEGWSIFNEFVISPQDIVLTVSGTPRPLAEIRVPKRWRNTFGVRAGAEYVFPFQLALRAGLLFEQGATPTEYTSIDFPNFTRVFVTAGVGYPLGPVEIVGAVAFLPTGNVQVNNSQVVAINALGVPGSVVGNGSYASGGIIGSLGIRGHFGGGTKMVGHAQP